MPPRKTARSPREATAEVIRVTKHMTSEYVQKGDVAGAKALIDDRLLSRGLKPTIVTANVLIKTYCNAGDVQGGERVLNEQMAAWDLTPDGCSFSTLIDAHGVAGRVTEAHRLTRCAEAAHVADALSARRRTLRKSTPASPVGPHS